MSERIDRIRDRLMAGLAPIQLDVLDEGHKHVGHEGARDGRGHFHVHIVSARFSGLPLIKRHQCVYAALGEMMQTDIHALALDTRAPGEV